VIMSETYIGRLLRLISEADFDASDIAMLHNRVAATAEPGDYSPEIEQAAEEICGEMGLDRSKILYFTHFIDRGLSDRTNCLEDVAAEVLAKVCEIKNRQSMRRSAQEEIRYAHIYPEQQRGWGFEIYTILKNNGLKAVLDD
jgi:hypothetical protein